MKYLVYFEVFGKKMKAEIDADSPEDAKYKLYGKIIFHKVHQVGYSKAGTGNDTIDRLNDIFGMFK